MTRVSVLPHRVSTNGVDAGRWSVRVGGVEHDSSASIVDWDRGVPLEVRSEIRVDPEMIREECGLDARAPLALIGTWHATATNVRRVGLRLDIDQRSTRTIGFAIDPAVAAGTVRLIRRVVLARDHEARDPLSACQAGAILWREQPSATTNLELRSTADQFSIEAVDFAELATVETDAAWMFDVDLSDPDRSASAVLRLVANSAHPAVDRLLGTESAEQRRLVESVLRWDVARTVIERALEQQRFVDGYGEFAAETVGGVAQRLLQLHLPDRGIDELAAMRRDAPERLDALLQGRLRVLRSE